jgi:hypothetical protein
MAEPPVMSGPMLGRAVGERQSLYRRSRSQYRTRVPRHAYTIKRGSTGQQILIYAEREGSREPAVGLRHDAPGARAAAGFVELDRELTPGVYQLGLPDELLAEGAARALLMLRFAGVTIEPVQIDLVAFDPQDPIRLGMSALGPEARVQALQGAFPLLARREIEERMAALSAAAPEKPPGEST